jgi:serine/threonine protein kinase
MEPMDGDLTRLLDKRALTPAEICTVMRAVDSQVTYIRSLHTGADPYIYTDIKLENILYRFVRGRLVVKLGDLGAAHPSTDGYYRSTFPCYARTTPAPSDDNDQWYNISVERADECIRELLQRLFKLLQTRGRHPKYDPYLNYDELRYQPVPSTNPVEGACVTQTTHAVT